MRYDKRRACPFERTTYKQQLATLEEVFNQTRYPDVLYREKLAVELELTPKQIKTWFFERRALELSNRRTIGSGGNVVGKLEDESPTDPSGSNSGKSVSASSSTPSPVSVTFNQSVPVANRNQNGYYGAPEQWRQAQRFQSLSYNHNYPYPYHLMNYNYDPQNNDQPPSSSASK
uniref:Homeobox domain-containing protein n=1 Tax=Panagrellus redivivus TaxID=6233 RepID=A0A7E5A153_PANRE